MQNFGLLLCHKFIMALSDYFLWSCYAGEDIWRFVGKLSDAQKSMLDDRFKWKVSSYFACVVCLFDILNHWWWWCNLPGPGDGKEEGRKARWSKGHFEAVCQGKWVCIFSLFYYLFNFVPFIHIMLSHTQAYKFLILT